MGAVALKDKKAAPAIPTYAWVVMGVVMLAGVSAPLNQFKVPPVMPVLMDQFKLDLSTAGLLMSIFAITGLVLALPAGIILQKLGARVTGVVAVGCLSVGAGLGALAQNAGTLLATRLIEGVGMGLIAVVAPAVIAAWFPPERRGLPMGIWATWVSLGSLIIYNLAPAVNQIAGWQAVWWCGAAFALVACLLYGLLLRLPSAAGSLHRATKLALAGEPAGQDYKKVLSNYNLWLLGLAFACFNFVVIGVVATYYPTYLKTTRGFSLADASLITSLKMLVVILTAPLAGLLTDRIRSSKRIILASFVALAIFMFFPFAVNGWLIPAGMVVLGMIAGSLSSATFAAVPELAGSQLAGLGMGIIMVGQNLGQLAGPVIFSRLVQSAGWATAGYCMITVALLGLAATGLTRMR